LAFAALGIFIFVTMVASSMFRHDVDHDRLALLGGFCAGIQTSCQRRGPRWVHINSLLCIVLNNARRTNLCSAWILSGVAQASPLPEEIPALIQFDLDFRELLAVCARRSRSSP
jgi:hypothetical protein